MSRILVVDDNETMRSGVALVVQRMGHDAVTAASGAEGLARLDEEAFDLVVTDYRMNEMDGLQVLEAVRAQHAETDVIIITAYGTIEIAVEAIQHGAADFITKPFPPEALELKLMRVLSNRADRQERVRLDEEKPLPARGNRRSLRRDRRRVRGDTVDSGIGGENQRHQFLGPHLWGKAVPERSWWREPSTATAIAAPGPSSRSTAPACRAIW